MFPFVHPRNLAQILGADARKRGCRSEHRVLEALSLPSRPAWIRTVRAATKAEDRAGIDVVIESDLGKLYVQVKTGTAVSWTSAAPSLNGADTTSSVRVTPAPSTKTTVPLFGVTSSNVATRGVPPRRSAQARTDCWSPQKSMSLLVNGASRASAGTRPW